MNTKVLNILSELQTELISMIEELDDDFINNPNTLDYNKLRALELKAKAENALKEIKEDMIRYAQ